MMTTNRSRLAYARLCVEIGLEAELPKVIIIRDPNGGLIEQYVEYEWVPVQCKVCHVYQENRCIKKPKLKQVWKAKDVETEKFKNGRRLLKLTWWFQLLRVKL